MALKTLLKAFSGDPIASLESKLQAAQTAEAAARQAVAEHVLAEETEALTPTGKEFGVKVRRDLQAAENRVKDLSGALQAARQRQASERQQAEADAQQKHQAALEAAHADALRTAENVQMTLDKLKIKLDEFRASSRALGALNPDSEFGHALVDMNAILVAHMGHTLGIKVSPVAPEVLSNWQSRIPPVS
jgi:hypothetical protein